jgi:hypothetical protein
MGVLMQHAWLEYDTGFWLLFTEGQNKGEGTVRTWMDKTAALSELAGEGWTISGQNPKRHRSRVHPGFTFLGYTLLRTIQ